MDLEKIFRGIGRRMLADFEDISSQVTHRGAKGRIREKRSARNKAVQQHRSPRRWRVSQGAWYFRQVLECAGAPVLFDGRVAALVLFG